MKKINILIFFVLSLLVFVSGLHDQFRGTGERADPFMFYNYVTANGTVGRLKANIYKEVGVLITIFSLLLLWWRRETRIMQYVIFPFLIISFLDLLDYIFFYQQYAFLKLSILLILIGWSFYKIFKK
tara:strand:+ start:540 stop:920 length:381 start_codon:yes stop_codon:yes gene_type:complete